MNLYSLHTDTRWHLDNRKHKLGHLPYTLDDLLCRRDTRKNDLYSKYSVRHLSSSMVQFRLDKRASLFVTPRILPAAHLGDLQPTQHDGLSMILQPRWRVPRTIFGVSFASWCLLLPVLFTWLNCHSQVSFVNCH